MNLTAEEVLEDLIGSILSYLEELKCVTNTPYGQFVYGEKTALVEIAEILRRYEKAAAYGLNFNVEEKYPL